MRPPDRDLISLGPLEVAFESWKLYVLCYKWWEQDVKTVMTQV